MNVFGKISLLVMKHGVSAMIQPPNDRVQSVWGKNLPKFKKTAISKIKSKEYVNCFIDAEGVTHRDFVPEGQKVNAEFYVGVLDQRLKRTGQVRIVKFQSSECFLLHDNALL
jgi:hypothetical protein